MSIQGAPPDPKNDGMDLHDSDQGTGAIPVSEYAVKTEIIPNPCNLKKGKYMKRIILAAVITVVCVVNAFAQSAHILIWDNDNNTQFYSADEQKWVYCYQSLQQELERQGIQVTVLARLPESAQLSAYDALFISLGFMCTS